ncbi:hypothetical protein C0Q88_07795 [Ralstonia pickettii]|uniref:Uncharacterized protein n=1 Tax=Ralstonia pickettii TaxID=329 RepID=A0A2N4TY33_RALPI|nr:hypothetical protein [Ralstonia pickettii]PLC44573.1 hypothetical protein C0Q88_07795 [Ralstonia pickettii]
MSLNNEVNPFLIDVPQVTIVRLVRVVNGVEVETPDTDCRRIWTRTTKSGAAGAQQTEIVAQPEGNRVTPDPLNRDNLRSY